MTGIVQELNSLAPDTLVHLFEFNTLPIVETPTGNDSLYYTNQNLGGASGIPWGGNLYKPFPFEFSDISSSADGSALPRPTLSISNINKTFFTAFLLLGDLSGTEVIRTVTCWKYTDGQPDANTLAFLSVHKYIIVRKTSQNKYGIEYELATSFDRPTIKLPRRQVLRDKTTNNVYAPGVSRTRIRS